MEGEGRVLHGEEKRRRRGEQWRWMEERRLGGEGRKEEGRGGHERREERGRRGPAEGFYKTPPTPAPWP